jgi:hypothetical protein
MLDWMKKRISPPTYAREPILEQPREPVRAMSGKYRFLYKYLEERYANTVVLTFGEIEDLLGFSLPEQARVSQEWWTDAVEDPSPNYSDSWILARRTATPNLRARSVAFERLP